MLDESIRLVEALSRGTVNKYYSAYIYLLLPFFPQLSIIRDLASGLHAWPRARELRFLLFLCLHAMLCK